MKFSTSLIALAIGAGLFPGHARVALAQSESVGSGTRGGGEIIDIDSTPYLRDLVTKSVCEWKRGGEFIEGNPYLKGALKRFAQLDWLFTMELEREIRDLNFCMTGPLYKVPDHETQRNIPSQTGERTHQVAYRYNREAYIDSSTFKNMNPANQAMLIIHETMHSYLPMGLADRSMKLRSIVKTLDKVRKREIVTREKLHYEMQMNEVNFPLDVAILDEKKEEVLFFTSYSVEDKVQLLRKLPRPEDLLKLTSLQLNSLRYWDISGRRALEQLFTEGLLATLQDSSEEEMTGLLEQKEWTRIDPLKVALSHFHSFTLKQRQALLASKKFSALMENGFNPLIKAPLFYEHSLIQASPEFLDALGMEAHRSAPLLSLNGVTSLPPSLNWILETLLILDRSGELDHLLKNEKFYRSFGLKSQKEALGKMKIQMPREKGLALWVLKGISTSLINALLHQLELKVGPARSQEIIKRIDFNQFDN